MMRIVGVGMSPRCFQFSQTLKSLIVMFGDFLPFPIQSFQLFELNETDGRCNVSSSPGIEPWPDALNQARSLAAAYSAWLVVDTETGWPRLGRAVDLADALNAHYAPLEEVLGRPLPDRFRRAV